MRRLGTISLLLVGGCFNEAPDADPDASSTGGAQTQTADGVEASTGPQTQSTSGDVTSGSSSSGVAETEAVTVTVTTDDGSTGTECPPGTRDCPCRAEPAPPCSLGETCLDGLCAAIPDPPDACLVSHGGGPDPVTFAVSRILADGTIGESSLTEIPGVAHMVSAQAAGPEMLVACGGFLYAALEGTGEVQPLALGQRDELVPLPRITVTDAFGTNRGSLRALLCADSVDRLVTVSGIDNEAGNSQISVRSLVLNPDGSLGEDGDPVDSPYNTGGDPFESLRAAWESVGNTAIILANRPKASPSGDPTVRQVQIVPGGPHEVLGNLGVPLRTSFGGVAVDPRTEYLAITGTRLEDGTGVGARLDIDEDGRVRNPFAATIPRETDADAWGAASSLILVEHGIGNVRGLMAGDGRVVIADFMQEIPTELAVFDTLGSGNTAVQLAHGGTVLITTNTSRVTTYDFTQAVEDIGDSELAAVQRALPSHSASVVVPCAD